MFEIEIKTGGAAFRSETEVDKNGDYILDPEAYEVRKILADVVRKLGYGHTDGIIIDTNGNRVGKWEYSD